MITRVASGSQRGFREPRPVEEQERKQDSSNKFSFVVLVQLVLSLILNKFRHGVTTNLFSRAMRICVYRIAITSLPSMLIPFCLNA